VTDLRKRANEQAQAALRAAADFRIKHGRRSPMLDAIYEAHERVVDAIDDVLSLTALADPGYADEWRTAALSGSYSEPDELPDIPLADVDAGNHFAGMPR
jgi:hypothetical protein